MSWAAKCIVLYCVLSTLQSYYVPSGLNKSIKRLAFGSCFNGFLKKRMDIFKTILNSDPDVFVWLGDTTYVDDPGLHFFTGSQFKLNVDQAKERYNSSFNEPEYGEFRKNKPVIGIWDDHDYGTNNGNKDYHGKETIKQIFLDFLEEPKDSNRRKEGRSIHTSYTFGQGLQSVKVIIPDLRFDLTKSQMMSEDQWAWLDKELNSEETFTILISGVQFLTIYRSFWFETWHISERNRLVQLLKKHKKSGFFILSGDIHLGEFHKFECKHPCIIILIII